MPRWRDLLGIFRRLEARGEVRGGRFLSGFGGEQFALPEAVESLREMRRRGPVGREVMVAAADPLNLVGIVVPGERVAAVPGKTVAFMNGAVAGASATETAAVQVLEIAAESVDAGLFGLPATLLRESGQSTLEGAGV
jgi:ATP-dependent helicase Lhr and Lhr-like helicase